METETSKYFSNIISQINEFFSNVESTIDHTPQRQILRVNAAYKNYRIFITELTSPDYRKYNYYILKDEYVLVGFDNSQDIRAIKMK
ncbi:MAG: hypothetical protein K8R54_01395 [Bacteroidales bacterium]|nr:hypothetical protein [Bacteroidales bacterium]